MENKQNLSNFWIFPAHGKIAWDGPKWGRECLFPANPDLADILGDTDFDFKNFYFWDFLGSQLGPGLGPGLGPNLGPGLGLGLGPSLGPDAAAGGAGAGRTLRSQPDPSPNAPRDQIRRKDPCCDLTRTGQNSWYKKISG